MQPAKPTLRAVVGRLNPAFVARHTIAPTALADDGLAVAMHDPDDRAVTAALQFATGLPITPAGASEGRPAVGPSLIDRIAARRNPPPLPAPAADLRLRIAGNEILPLDGAWEGGAFACTDERGWRELRIALGTGMRIDAIVGQADVFPLALPEMPRDEAELRIMLGRFAPLRLADLAWSQPFSPARPVASRQVEVSLVRRRWLQDWIAMIETQLSPHGIAVSDEAGHRIGFQPRKSGRRRIIATLAIAAMVLLGGIGGYLIARLPEPRPAAAPIVRPQPARPPVSVAPVAPAPVVAAPPAPANDKLVLIGIAGRLPDDARVLVRTPWGKTVTMQLGDSLLGWRIVTIAADRITLDKAGQRRELIVAPAP